jgi:pilus assembly protein CpaE
MHKRPEISTRDFAKAIESPPVAAIPFDSKMFGTAANNGQMIAELSSSHKVAGIFQQLAQDLTGRMDSKKAKPGLLSPLLGMFLKR